MHYYLWIYCGESAENWQHLCHHRWCPTLLIQCKEVSYYPNPCWCSLRNTVRRRQIGIPWECIPAPWLMTKPSFTGVLNNTQRVPWSLRTSLQRSSDELRAFPTHLRCNRFNWRCRVDSQPVGWQVSPVFMSNVELWAHDTSVGVYLS